MIHENMEGCTYRIEILITYDMYFSMNFLDLSQATKCHDTSKQINGNDK